MKEQIDVKGGEILTKKSSSMKTKRRNEIIFLCCIFALPILHKLTFYCGTAFQSVALAFKSYDSNAGSYFYSGFINFQNVLRDLGSDVILRTSLKNTVIYYLVDTFIGIPTESKTLFIKRKTRPLCSEDASLFKAELKKINDISKIRYIT